MFKNDSFINDLMIKAEFAAMNGDATVSISPDVLKHLLDLAADADEIDELKHESEMMRAGIRELVNENENLEEEITRLHELLENGEAA